MEAPELRLDGVRKMKEIVSKLAKRGVFDPTVAHIAARFDVTPSGKRKGGR